MNATRLVVQVLALFWLIALSSTPYAQIGAAAERAAARAAVTAAERQAAKRSAQAAGESTARRSVAKSADGFVKRHTVSLCRLRGPCPLPPTELRKGAGPKEKPIPIAESFVGGSYDEVILGQDTILYRAYHDSRGGFGNPNYSHSFWTRSKIKDTQAVMDSAIPATKGGNMADRLFAIRVPKGTTVFEGKAQGLDRGPIGGGNQVVIKNVKPDWEIAIDNAR